MIYSELSERECMFWETFQVSMDTKHHSRCWVKVLILKLPTVWRNWNIDLQTGSP